MPIQHLQVYTDRGNYWNFGQVAKDNEVLLLQDKLLQYKLILLNDIQIKIYSLQAEEHQEHWALRGQ